MTTDNFDSTAPSGSLMINGGDKYARSTYVTLGVAASDPQGGAIMMRFRNTGGSWSVWEPYETTKKWSLRLIQGTRKVLAEFKDASDNRSRYATDTIFLDSKRPYGERIRAPFLLSNVNTKRNIKLKWTAFDLSPSSGMIRDIQFKRNPAGKWTNWKVGVLGTTAYFKKAIPGTTYHFRMRARDNAGNIGNWSKTNTTIVPYDQDQLVISRRGFIHNRPTEANKHWLATLRYSIHPGFRVKYRFTGKSIYLVSTLGLGRGRAKIFIDGVRVKTVDTYDRDTRYRRVIFSKKWRKIDTHVMEIVNLGTQGRPRFDIDALGVGR